MKKRNVAILGALAIISQLSAIFWGVNAIAESVYQQTGTKIIIFGISFAICTFILGFLFGTKTKEGE